MTRFKGKYRIETTRLKNWDYASPGYYFVTICTRRREHFFGEVVSDKMCLSPVGEIAQQFWSEIPAHFIHVQLDEYVIMPNHVHGIVRIVNNEAVEMRHGASLRDSKGNRFGPLKRGSLQAIINAYKGSVTRIGREISPHQFAWQTGFHDRIIRDEAELNRTRIYIQNNAAQWGLDQNNDEGLWV